MVYILRVHSYARTLNTTTTHSQADSSRIRESEALAWICKVAFGGCITPPGTAWPLQMIGGKYAGSEVVMDHHDGKYGDKFALLFGGGGGGGECDHRKEQRNVADV